MVAMAFVLLIPDAARATLGGFDQTGRRHLPQQPEQILLAARRVDIVLGDQRISDRRHGDRRVDQVPDPAAHVVQAVVDPGVQVEDDAFATQVLPGVTAASLDRGRAAEASDHG